MKIFKKTHFWKDNRTFIDIDAEEPKKERGYPAEGNLLLKIGEQSTIKSAFKLSVDEARALRDSIDMFLRFHDMKLSELMSEGFEKQPDYPSAYKDDYSYNKEPQTNYQKDDYSYNREQPSYQKEEYSYKEPAVTPQQREYPSAYKEDYAAYKQPDLYGKPAETKTEQPFFIFGNEEQPKKEEKKPNVEFYF